MNISVMNIKKYKHIALALLASVAFASCGDSLSEINENPNATTDPQPAYLLTYAEYASANAIWGSAASYNSTLLWVQHWAKIQYTEPDCYDVDNTDFVSPWNTFYATIIADLDGILSSEKSDDATKAVATVWESWAYLQLTNFYGDIPYSEYGTSATPAYDTQETVLRSILSKLEESATTLRASSAAVDGDIIYGGDTKKWAKLANSLRLRVALEIADRDEATAKQIIASLYADRSQLISSNDDIAKFTFTASPQWNPWASAFSSRDDQRVSKTLVDKLKSLNDPRLELYADVAANTGVYEGAANGLSADAANNQGFSNVSRPGAAFLEDDTPAYFYTYAELLFNLAEAAQRGWISADAATLYKEGVKASLEQYGISDSDIEAYLSQDAVAYDADNWAETIGVQKWIAFYGQGPDAFADWRRLGHPTLSPGPNSALSSGQMPRRFFYPNTEQSRNGENYKAAVANQGADEVTTRLWFDVEAKNR